MQCSARAWVLGRVASETRRERSEQRRRSSATPSSGATEQRSIAKQIAPVPCTGPPGRLPSGRAAMGIEEIFRAEHGRIIATLIRLLDDFDVAEEALQEACAAALEQ